MKELQVFDSLVATARKHPDHTAIVDELGSMSYKQLLSEVLTLSHRLKESDLQPGFSAGLLTENNRYFIIGLYAIVSTGAVAMPIFHRQKPQEILTSIREAELTFVLSSKEKFLEAVNLQGKNLDSTYLLASTGTSHQLLDSFPTAAFMRFTSGTTGQAKGVVISHQAAIERIEAANKSLQITTQDRVLWVFPMAYHFIVSIVLYIHQGASIVINNDFLAEEIIQSINQHKATFFYCAPMHIKLLAAYETDSSIPSLRKVISTTTGASKTECEAFQNKYGLTVEQAFGIIEVGLPIINTVDARNHPDAVGHPLPDDDIKILDDNENESAENEIGKLAIKGPGMFDGYLKSPLSKNELLVNGYFLTGDLAVKDAAGMITIKGREKNVIIVHGNKVFPNEVEEVINSFPGIVRSKVYGQNHPLVGEMVVAEIQSKTQIETEKLIKHCKQSLSPYKVPQKIKEVVEIKMTASGKVKRT